MFVCWLVRRRFEGNYITILLSDNLFSVRAAFLEKENAMLKADLDEANFENTKLAMERDILKKKLAQYE